MKNIIREQCVNFQGYKQRNAYILTQSPMTNTVVDLWRLLVDHRSVTVIMLDHNDVTDEVHASLLANYSHVYLDINFGDSAHSVQCIN